MLDEQTLSINFGQGIDTKTDPKLVVSSKLTALQNGIFTDAKRVSKRNGYDAMTLNRVGGGTISSPVMVKSFNNELLCAAGGNLYSYSETLNGWQARGVYNSVAVSNSPVSAPYADQLTPSGTLNPLCVVSGNLSLVVYQSGGSGNDGIYACVIDNQTGTKIISDFYFGTGTSGGKPVLLGGSTFAVMYADGAQNLLLQTLTLTLGGGAVFNSAVTVDATGTMDRFEVIGTSSGAIVMYNEGGTLHVKTLNTSGSTVNSATIAAAGTFTNSPLCISQGTDGNIWTYWTDSGTLTSATLYYAVWSSTLAVVLAKTTIAATLSRCFQVTVLPASTTQQTVYFSVYSSAPPGSVNIPSIKKISVQSNGTIGSSSVVINNVDIYSKIATIGSKNYMAVMFMSQVTPTAFLLDLSTTAVVAKFLYGKAEGAFSVSNSGTRGIGFLGDIQSLGNNRYSLCCGYISTSNDFVITSGTGTGSKLQNTFLAATNVIFDFAHIDANQAISFGGSIVLNGAVMSMYDGLHCSELGFNYDPDNVQVATAGGGNVDIGQHEYFVVYEWTDANGNLHQSAPSVVYYVNLVAASTVTVYAQSLSLTQKGNVFVSLYRTIASGTSVAYKVATALNSSLNSYITLSDNTADANITNNPTLYTQGGAILENFAPPPSMVMWSNNNRLFVVDSMNPETTIEYSKSQAIGYGISFSTGQLELVVESKLGAIRGASPMDEKTVLLKENGFMVFIGDGANDAGTGSTFSNTQIIPSEVGCTNSKSVALISAGIMFRSLSGIYLLSRGTSVQYLGAEVEAYNAQDIQSVTLVPGKSQIRILTSSGSSLVYDYVFNQWSTFTNHSGLSSDVWNGVYIYVRSDGNIYKENSSTFLDGATAYQLSATTAWIKASQIQGFERVRRIAMLGDFQGAAGHGVQISAAYDWSTSFSAPISYSFTGANAAFQYRERLPQQKCNALQLQIQEVTTGVSGEFVDFSDLGLEIGAKRGLNKLPAAASVG